MDLINLVSNMGMLPDHRDCKVKVWIQESYLAQNILYFSKASYTQLSICLNAFLN